MPVPGRKPLPKSSPECSSVIRSGLFVAGEHEGRTLLDGCQPGCEQGNITGMQRQQAIQDIRERVNQIAATVTAIHPQVPGLADAPTQTEMFKALFELTKQVEVIKKHLLKLEKRDDSALL